MTRQELMAELEAILEEARTAVLGTSGQDGRPRMRWMTPVLIRGRTGVIFAVTSPLFEKIQQLKSHPQAEWMFQNLNLNKVVNIKGRINILDNPSIRSEVLEAVGPRLHAFWKVSQDTRDLLVLETVIEQAVYYLPMKGSKETVDFS